MSIQDTISHERIRNQMKNKIVGILLSFCFPGAGHMYAGQIMKGVIILVTFTLCVITSFLIVPGLIAMILWGWAMYSVNNLVIEHNDRLLANELENQKSI
ncbi:DUF6677 family protein [Shewanella sp. 4_MG-2023]|uniref:DUF6677 family protein n=1 Tax=Shewanella sp. 4_MG-2023 TaxID=3062652 RepID=UPI0026E3F5BB|nr:DUF6677 family protein [Shewanella sp. 4_MG-2023]MDO6677079.1 hypothetical protein [Shewanella sp. 4_MG-2023]